MDNSGMNCRNNGDDARTANLVYAVFRTVGSEFYAWDKKHCLETLHSLLRPVQVRATRQPTENIAQQGRDFSDVGYTTAAREEFEIWDSTASPGSTYTTVSVEVTESSVSLRPYPSYESCTPTARSISVGDDVEPMQFMPYSDDPEFDYKPYNDKWDFFAWQNPHTDPDLEVIVVETVRRLTSLYQLPISVIDDVEVLPLKLHPSNKGRGLLRLSRLRDYPKWLGFPQGTSFPSQPVHASATDHGPLPSVLKYFCNNLNCLIGFCFSHTEDAQMPKPASPRINNEILAQSVEKPCGVLCFIFRNAFSIPSTWTDDDISILNTTLDHSPDVLPCDLAIICRKPCREVFKHRQSRFLKPPSPPTGAKENKPQGQKNIYNDHNANKFSPNRPCAHEGPCEESTGCECRLNKSHCGSTCRCDKQCAHRRPGCSCTKSQDGETCSSATCPCFQAYRECDPILCIGCNARSLIRDESANVCRNVAIQQGHTKRTETRLSAWGLGLFLVDPAEVIDLIGEYTGELIFEPTVQLRDVVATHRHRNYVFRLNYALSVDSGNAGNETRFINHDREAANCEAKVRLVNGDHRIGIFASKKINAGEELLLNYGEFFFKDSSQPSVEDDIKEDENHQDHSSDGTYNESD